MFFYALLSHKSAEVIWQLITDLRTLFPEYKYNVTSTIYFFLGSGFMELSHSRANMG